MYRNMIDPPRRRGRPPTKTHRNTSPRSGRPPANTKKKTKIDPPRRGRPPANKKQQMGAPIVSACVNCRSHKKKCDGSQSYCLKTPEELVQRDIVITTSRKGEGTKKINSNNSTTTRKRGRPKREEDIMKDASKSPPHKRGRPKKVASVSKSRSLSNDTAAVVVARKRGRPKKDNDTDNVSRDHRLQRRKFVCSTDTVRTDARYASKSPRGASIKKKEKQHIATTEVAMTWQCPKCTRQVHTKSKATLAACIANHMKTHRTKNKNAIKNQPQPVVAIRPSPKRSDTAGEKAKSMRSRREVDCKKVQPVLAAAAAAVSKDKMLPYNHPTASEEEMQYPAEPATDLPKLWVTRRIPRKKKSRNSKPRSDIFWYSPKLGLRFKSKRDALNFVEAYKQCRRNEENAIKMFKEKTWK